MPDSLKPTKTDVDPLETEEWLEALDAVIKLEGPQRAHYLIQKLIEKTRQDGYPFPCPINTAYINTIPADKQAPMPGDAALERKIRSIIRWNAMAMVVRANKKDPTLGGHIATFASAATLYDVGFNHFWHAANQDHDGDLIYIQGHSSPGIYARAFLEGRIDAAQLDRFRQESEPGGLSSYPHPWLMPNFWQFPTVSMGLGPIMAIYQARFLKYLEARQLRSTAERKVWCFIGDGETDEPETLGAIALAVREKLDNLIFVINCNLQRLDGPVRGNGKIIQELEADFCGAGWRVIKVIWGSYWDALLANDKEGHLKRIMDETVDGEYQNYKAKGGAYTREHFFCKHPELEAMVAHLSDQEIWRLNRGGHDPHKVYAAYHEAIHTQGQPTVILAKTIKGYGMGTQGEGMNHSHQQKKLDIEHLIEFKTRFDLPIADADAQEANYYKPENGSPEMQYMCQQRKALGGFLPSRVCQAEPLTIPPLSFFQNILKSSEGRKFSTTTAFVRMLSALTKAPDLGDRIVPIIPDEARTFGMDGLFRQMGIYSSVGQAYEPQDKDQVMYYREDHAGQILEEGINEAGAMSSWIAAATAYANHHIFMVPFYIFYSMFGFQRIGDLAWAAGDSQSRGFLLGATSGRTTLNGEGLQHQDGHSHVFAATIPNCLSYDPCFAFELAVILQNGLQRMYQDNENIFYYITLNNENYPHPGLPDGAAENIVKGMYCLKTVDQAALNLLGSGAILQEVMAAAELLADEFNIKTNLWSVTSFNQLAREGQHSERYNLLHPNKAQMESHVSQCLNSADLPIIAATDYVRAYAEQIRAYLKPDYTVLGTDGFGRSDTREKLRHFFEIDRYHIVIAALSALSRQGKFSHKKIVDTLQRYRIDPDKPNPLWS